jgi:hypothetical protein
MKGWINAPTNESRHCYAQEESAALLSYGKRNCAYQFGGGGIFGEPNVQDRAGEVQATREEGVKT